MRVLRARRCFRCRTARRCRASRRRACRTCGIGFGSLCVPFGSLCRRLRGFCRGLCRLRLALCRFRSSLRRFGFPLCGLRRGLCSLCRALRRFRARFGGFSGGLCFFDLGKKIVGHRVEIHDFRPKSRIYRSVRIGCIARIVCNDGFYKSTVIPDVGIKSDLSRTVCIGAVPRIDRPRRVKAVVELFLHRSDIGEYLFIYVVGRRVGQYGRYALPHVKRYRTRRGYLPLRIVEKELHRYNAVQRRYGVRKVISPPRIRLPRLPVFNAFQSALRGHGGRLFFGINAPVRQLESQRDLRV